MKLLDRLERRFGRYAVPNVTVALIVCQVLVYVMHLVNPGGLPGVALIPSRVLQGEVWRLVSFLFQPFSPDMHPIFAFFFWYLFYLMGTSLEQTWGAFRYNVYLLIGYLATVGVSFLGLLFAGDQAASPLFLQGSVFLAFAYLYPNFELALFLILPVKIKWLALLTWLGYGFQVLVGPWLTRFVVLAAIANFLAFFGKEIVLRVRSAERRKRHRAQQEAAREQPFHRCRICGVTDKTNPEMTFRYCSKCAGGCCYCTEHLHDHEHVRREEAAAEKR